MHHHRYPRRSEPGHCTRRAFLRISGGASALAALGTLSALAPARSQATAGAMHSRPIPSSGERIPVVGLGSARTFNVNPDDGAAMEPLAGVMRNFFDGGGRVVDSSPMYGRAERVIGELARRLGIADELFMATKVWTRGEAEGIAQMKRSAERMGVARLDLIQVHNLVDLRTQLATLERWREEGRVRYVGITHSSAWSHDDLTQLVESQPLDFVQLNYNILERNAERRLLPAAAHHGVATLINEPFEKGTLFRRVRGQPLPQWAAEIDCRSWAQLFLKFILGQPAVTCVIPATSDPEHAADNVRAGYGALPDAAQRERMAQAMASL